jgi:serine protease Do
MRATNLMAIGLALLGAAGVLADVDHTLGLSVVQVHAYPGDMRTYFGSGVAIGHDRVATNCHVTRHAKAIAVAKGALRFKAVAQKTDSAHDLCVLEIPGLSVPGARIGSADRLHIGQTVFFYGFPRAMGMAYSEGRVEALHPFEGSVIVETSADFTSGASGGGLFNDAGELVGLATFLPVGHSMHTYAIPIDWLTKLAATSARAIAPFGGRTFWENVQGLPAFLRVPAPPVEGRR